MSVSKVVSASEVIVNAPAVLFGVTVAVSHASPDPPPSASAIINIYDDDTTTSPTKKVQSIALKTQADDGKSFQAMFPAGIRCGNGITVEITASGHTVSVSVDYS